MKNATKKLIIFSNEMIQEAEKICIPGSLKFNFSEFVRIAVEEKIKSMAKQ